jgi:hypothetical protein
MFIAPTFLWLPFQQKLFQQTEVYPRVISSKD